jgi:hypothetical protein
LKFSRVSAVHRPATRRLGRAGRDSGTRFEGPNGSPLAGPGTTSKPRGTPEMTRVIGRPRAEPQLDHRRASGKDSRSSGWSSALRSVVDDRLRDHTSWSSGRRCVSGPHSAKLCRGSAPRWLEQEQRSRTAPPVTQARAHAVARPDDRLDLVSGRSERRASGFLSRAGCGRGAGQENGAGVKS